MFEHYFKTSLRILSRFKLFSFLNILGLSIGLCVSILIFLFTHHELSFDKHIKNVDRIYLGTYGWAFLNAPSVNSYEHTTAGIEVVSLVSPFHLEKTDITFKEKTISVKTIEVDSNFLKVFEYPVVFGNLESGLQHNNSTVLTASTAQKLFGDEDPIGQVIIRTNTQTHEKLPFTVDLVIEDLNKASSLDFDILYHDPNIRSMKDRSEWSYVHYIKLNKGADSEEVNNKWIAQILPSIGKEGEIEDIKSRPALNGLFPMKDVYFKLGEKSNHKAGNKDLVYIFLGVGILILSIACFNFININSSLAIKRHKEIGIRKTLGGTRISLFLQMTGESILSCLISFVFAIILLEIALLPLMNWIGEAYQPNIFGAHLSYFLIMIGGVILLGIISGLYPASILSSYQPISLVSGVMSKGPKALYLRRSLIVFQFVISVFLIVCTTAILFQLKHIENTPLGFNKDHIAYVNMPFNGKESAETILYDLEQSPHIEMAGIGHSIPGDFEMGWGREYKDKVYYFKGLPCDHKYMDILGIEMLQGRKFVPEDSKHKEAVIILNESAYQMIGDEEIIGQTIGSSKVIGVCKNFHIRNPAEGHTPVILHAQDSKWKMRNIILKLNTDNTAAAITFIQDYYTSNYPNETADIQFLNQTFKLTYGQNEKLAQMFVFFAILAIFIACLGLFGLSIFMAEQRSKEIAIRKVLGAQEFGLIKLQTKEYILLVIIGNILAGPLAYLASVRWLDQFVNHVNFHWYFFLIALIISLIISITTVAYISIRASRLNPIDVIKHE